MYIKWTLKYIDNYIPMLPISHQPKVKVVILLDGNVLRQTSLEELDIFFCIEHLLCRPHTLLGGRNWGVWACMQRCQVVSCRLTDIEGSMHDLYPGFIHEWETTHSKVGMQNIYKRSSEDEKILSTGLWWFHHRSLSCYRTWLKTSLKQNTTCISRLQEYN